MTETGTAEPKEPPKTVRGRGGKIGRGLLNWLTGNRPLFGDTLLIGKRGSGKSYLAIRLALEDDADGIAGNVPLDMDRANAVLAERYGEPAKRLKLIEHPRDFFGHTCDYRLLDEAQKYFPARGYKDADQKALQAVAEERKDDAWTCYTVQALRNLDVLVSSFADQVCRVEMRKAPLIGHLWPWCVRPTIICRHCGKARRDGRGDQTNWWERLLGMGSYVTWSVVDPDMVTKQRTLEGSAQPEEDPTVRARGRCLFDIDIANCYDSGQKVGEPPENAKPGRCSCRRKKEKTAGAAPPKAEAAAPADRQPKIPL